MLPDVPDRFAAAYVGARPVTRGVRGDGRPRWPIAAAYRGADMLWEWTPGAFFGVGVAGYWAGGYAPSGGGLYQDVVGTLAVTAPDQPVGLVRRAAGTVDASQATALAKPTLARWPRGGRRQQLRLTDDLPPSPWSRRNVTVSTQDGVHTITYDNSIGGQGAGLVQSSPFPFNHVTDFGKTVTSSIYVKQVLPAAGVRLSLQANTFEPVFTYTFATGALVDSGNIGAVMSAVAVGDGWHRLTFTYVINDVALPASRKTTFAFGPSGANGAAVLIRHPQCEFGAVATPYQHVTTANNVTEAGVPELWHLWNDGINDSLPVTLPAGVYGRAAIDVLGNVTVDTVTRATTGAVETLVQGRQADVVIRQGAFTPAEIARIEAYAGRMTA